MGPVKPLDRKPLKFSDKTRTAIESTSDHFVLTGGTGWLGRATLEMLEEALGPNLESRLSLFGSRSGQVTLKSGLQLIVKPLDELVNLSKLRTKLVHYAFVMRDQIKKLGRIEYLMKNLEISQSILDFSEQNEITGLFISSSGAARPESVGIGRQSDTDYYGAVKRHDESLFADLGIDDRRLAIIRIFNLSGPFMSNPDTYALGSFLNAIKFGKDIHIEANVPVFRSYVHVQDVVEVGFAIMMGIAEGSSEPFDTAAKDEIEIEELAKKVLETFDLQRNLRIERSDVNPDLPPDRYIGDGREFRRILKSLEVDPQVLRNQIQDTADYLWS